MSRPLDRVRASFAHGVRCRSSDLSACLAALLWLAPLARAAAEDQQRVSAEGHRFQIPVGPGRRVYPGAGGAPAQALDFIAEHGGAWRVSFDSLNETPRLIVPLKPVRAEAPGEPGGALGSPGVDCLIGWFQGFIAHNSDLFGVDPSRLGEPFVYRVRDNHVLVFPQTTPSGIPVRGASARVVVTEKGWLKFIRAFFARGVDNPEDALISKDEVEAAIRREGGTVHSARLQMGFLDPTDPRNVAPIWSVQHEDPEGRVTERIVDAMNGAMLASLEVEKRFDGGGEGGGLFFAEGTVKGACPDLDDIFAGPHFEESADNDLDGILLRDVRFDALTRSSRGRFLTVVEENPATLHASLQTGLLEPDGRDPVNDAELPLVEIAPRTPENLPGLRPEEDPNGDGVPDLTQTRLAGEGFEFVFNGVATGPREPWRAYWLQCFEHAQRMEAFAAESVALFLLPNPVTGDFLPFLPLAPLRIVPMDSPRGRQSYLPPRGNPPRPAEVLTDTSFASGGVDGAPETERVVPTVLMHEVGHHVFFNMTGSADASPEAVPVEEGIVDALTAFANSDSRLAYRRDRFGVIRPTRLGFSLAEHESGKFRDPIRRDVAEAFWQLRERFARQAGEMPNRAHGILVLWLAFGRVQDGDQRLFDRSADLYEQLLLVDDTIPPGDGDIENGTPYGGFILDAFRGRQLIDAPFVRGDANLDLRLDLSDAVSILGFLFLGGGLYHDCQNAQDADNDGKVDLSDAIRLLLHLFQGAPSLPEPSAACGLDPEEPGDPGNLGCREFTCPMWRGLDGWRLAAGVRTCQLPC